MYIEEDENEIIFNHYERQAIGSYLYKNLNRNNIDKDDFIHSYNNNTWNEGVNIYFDGRIDYYTTINDIDICFHTTLRKNKKGKVEKKDQDLLKYNTISKIEWQGGIYAEREDIFNSQLFKNIIEILDNIASEVYYQAYDVSYWFDGFMR